MALTKSLGIPDEAVRDQYTDGKAAMVWEIFMGDKEYRAKNYRNFLVETLRANGCKRVLDAAAGTGIDSIMLLEEGFEVVSVDGSDKMLKHAFAERWNRRKEPAFDKWVIQEANWLTLEEQMGPLIGEGFDAIMCIGNSVSHITDPKEVKLVLQNFYRCLKPGGLLMIDHRNYDHILKGGQSFAKCPYYDGNVASIKSSVLYVSGKPELVIRDYSIDLSDYQQNGFYGKDAICEFRFFFYPHSMRNFKNMIRDVFGEETRSEVYGDFKELEQVENPNYFLHVAKKSRMRT